MEQSISERSTFKRLMRALEERKAWEAAHPELAAAWTDAMREDANREQARERAQAVARAHIHVPDRLRALGVPAPVLERIRRPEDTPAMRAAKRYLLPEEPRWLVLLGGAGSGKTLAAAYVLGEWLAAHAQWTTPSGAQPPEIGLFASAGEFSGLADFNVNDRAWLERLAKCGLLVLDDLGAERLGEMELGLMQRLLMSRHARGSRTVITSNLAMGELGDKEGTTLCGRYGDRIVDRMREVARVVDAGKVSLRKKPALRRKGTTP